MFYQASKGMFIVRIFSQRKKCIKKRLFQLEPENLLRSDTPQIGNEYEMRSNVGEVDDIGTDYDAGWFTSSGVENYSNEATESGRGLVDD